MCIPSLFSPLGLLLLTLEGKMDNNFIHHAVEVMYTGEHIFFWMLPHTECKKWYFFGIGMCHLLLGLVMLIIISVSCRQVYNDYPNGCWLVLGEQCWDGMNIPRNLSWEVKKKWPVIHFLIIRMIIFILNPCDKKLLITIIWNEFLSFGMLIRY